jgi:small subunit ribosomal protein S16
MVKIRLARAGAKKRPFYHVVATESRSSRDGKFIERLGYYNPNAKGGEQKLVVDTARVDYWKGQGAQISERVAFLVKGVAPAAVAAETAA